MPGMGDSFSAVGVAIRKEGFDAGYKELVDTDVGHIAVIERRHIIRIIEEETQKALNKCKKQQSSGYEHLKSGGAGGGGGGGTTSCRLLNKILKCLNQIEVILKEDILTPIYKKGDSTNPGNYRGITVTPLILKVLEHILNARHNKILEESRSKLHKCFTSGSSSLNAALTNVF